MCSLISAGLWVAWSGIWLGTHQNKRIMMKLWACASSHFTLGPGFTLFPTWQGPVTKEIIIPFLDNQSQGLTFVKCPRRVCFQSSYPISSAMRDFILSHPAKVPVPGVEQGWGQWEQHWGILSCSPARVAINPQPGLPQKSLRVWKCFLHAQHRILKAPHGNEKFTCA